MSSEFTRFLKQVQLQRLRAVFTPGINKSLMIDVVLF